MSLVYKSGFAALVGRPNAGKSTLLNQLSGEHIAAVSSKPQTTRTRIRGIVTRPEGQIIFTDTPGIHQPGYTLNRRMMGLVAEALAQVDVVLLMRDVTAPSGSGERFALELVREAVKQSARPVLLLLNKVDALKDKKALLPMIQQYNHEFAFAEIIPLSAKTGEQVETLIGSLFNYLPEGPQLFAEDLFTDELERNIVAELVREKILALTGEELPYATAVKTEKWEQTTDATEIHCVIYVERESQKPIIIGKGGQMLREIGTRARRDIEKLLDRHVRLSLFVRVQPQWRNDPHLLDELGIEERKS
jgi:GTP-binding protein Era